MDLIGAPLRTVPLPGARLEWYRTGTAETALLVWSTPGGGRCLIAVDAVVGRRLEELAEIEERLRRHA